MESEAIAVGICWVRNHKHLRGNPTTSCRWSRGNALRLFNNGVSMYRHENPPSGSKCGLHGCIIDHTYDRT